MLSVARWSGEVLVKISARQTSYENYGALVELKSNPIVADPNAVMVSATTEFSDITDLCKIACFLDALSNRSISDTSEVSSKTVSE